MRIQGSLIKVLTVLVATTAIVLGTLSCGKKDAGEIIIGAVLPLTGDAAQWGIPPQKGAQLAVDEINEKGGISGRMLKTVFEDSECDPSKGVSAFQKLVTTDKTNVVIGGVCSSVTLGIAPIAETRKIVLISPASTNPKITDAGDYIFRVIPSDDLRGKVFARYLYEDVAVRNVALLYVNNEGGVGNRNTFVEEFERLGGRIVDDESYDQETRDLRSQLTKIKKSDADAVLAVSYPSDTVILMKQARELGLNKPLYFQTEAVEDPHVLESAADAAEGATYILPAAAEGEIPQKFAASYLAKYNMKPELFAAEAYDIVNLIAISLSELSGARSAQEIRSFLYNVSEYQGASGTITFDQNGDVMKPMAIKQIQGGQPILIAKK